MRRADNRGRCGGRRPAWAAAAAGGGASRNKAKLEVPGFIANLMKLPDDEIRSKCQARYHATPEPAHDDFDI